jgi:cell division protein FtsB
MRYWESQKPRRRRSAPKRSAPPKRSIAAGGSVRQYPFLRRFYQHQVVVSGRLQKFIFFLVVGTLLYAFVFSDAGAIRIMMLKKQKAEAEAQVASIEDHIMTLENEIERLKEDPDMMERLGRERYGYIYPGDRVYRIVHPPKE